MARRYDYDDEYDDDEDDYEDERPVSRRKRKGRRGGGNFAAHFLWFLVILTALFLTFFGYMYLSGKLVITSTTVDDAKEAVVKKAVTTLIEKEIKSQTGEKVDLEAMKESMEPEDQEKVDELLDKYADEDTVKEVISAYKETGGDLSQMKDVVTDIVDENDIDDMERLYEKYGSSYSGGQ